MNMITSKKLIKVARKWQKITAIERKRITSARTHRKMVAANHVNKSSTVDKGCFVMHTTGKRNLVIPLTFLSNNIFLELFKMFEKEFGLPTDGRIRLPCDSVFMNYIVSLVKRGLPRIWSEQCSIPLLAIIAHQILISIKGLHINSYFFVDSE